MKTLIAFLLVLAEPLCLATTAIVSRGDELELSPLHNYRTKVESRFHSESGQFGNDGKYEDSALGEATKIEFSGSLRLTESVDAFLAIPVIARSSRISGVSNPFGLGDLSAGVHFPILSQYFDPNWYPHLSLTLGYGFPTGTVKRVRANGRVDSGSGEGRAEAFIGLQALKELEELELDFRVQWAKRFSGSHYALSQLAPATFHYGNGGEAKLLGKIGLSHRFELGLGPWFRWEGETESRFGVVHESGYLWGASAFLSFEPKEQTVWAVGADFSIPGNGFGRNQETIRSISLMVMQSGF